MGAYKISSSRGQAPCPTPIKFDMMNSCVSNKRAISNKHAGGFGFLIFVSSSPYLPQNQISVPACLFDTQEYMM